MKKIFVILIGISLGLSAYGVEHPCLLLTRQGVKDIRASRGQVPLFDASLDALIADAEEALKRETLLPTPVDGGGGYSHEAHKLNYYDMYNCGIAWQLTGEKKYASKVREMLLAYADFYPSLDFHPLGLSGNPGRIFWQTLNESVFLVHTSVAYDCVYDFLSKKERKKLEEVFFRPYTDFIMTGLPHNRANVKMFATLNNWATWACAGVGMAGIVMGDDTLVQKALNGAQLDGSNGFLKQMDVLLSDDGYFTEGAFYQRYALWPFVTFAQCLQNYDPSLKIFERRDGILLKAVDALLQMAYDGEFMHFNDAMEKGYTAQELVSAVDIAYSVNPSNKELLWVAEKYQHKVVVTDAGFAVARAVKNGETKPLRLHSCYLRDGENSDMGAFIIMRPEREDLNSALTFKATSQGLGHGHFDRLTFAYYDSGNEIITDYGAARFLNIDAKYHGHYTHENETWSKATIAHNTLVVDERTYCGGKWKKAQKTWPEVYCYDFTPGCQMAAASEKNVYPGVEYSRYIAYAEVPFLQCPLIMDLLKVKSAGNHTYDYPIHYNGHMISLSVPYRKYTEQMGALGADNGYQHLWLEADATGGEGSTSYTWLTGYKMYSVTTATTAATEIKICRTGAGDPDFNLRSEPMILFREKGRGDHLFASCIETHGKYDIDIEQSANLEHSCKGVKTLCDNGECIIVRYDFAGGHNCIFAVWTASADTSASHEVEIPGEGKISWKGVYTVINN